MAMREKNPALGPRAIRRRGIVLVFVLVALLALVGFVSLAVDYGRVQVAKTELRRASDAAALAAVSSLSTSVAQAQTDAINVAGANLCDGNAVTLTASSIEFGTWSDTSKTFTPLSGTAQSTATAVRVTALRTAAAGNPIPLVFGGLIGRSTCDVRAQSVARTSTAGFSIVGISSLTTAKSGASGNRIPQFDSWNSSAGPYTTFPAGTHGNCSSNGNISLLTGTVIDGDCRPGIGKTVTNSAGVTGQTTPLTYTLNFPPPNVGTAATINNNSQLPSAYFNSSTRDFTVPNNQTLTLPGGIYYVNNVSWQSTTFVFTGPVIFYVTGTTFFTLNNHVTTYLNLPKNLKFEIVNAATVTYDFDQACNAVLYAPLSTVTTQGLADDYGAVVGKNLTMTVGWHVDESLGGAGVNGTIGLVQ